MLMLLFSIHVLDPCLKRGSVHKQVSTTTLTAAVTVAVRGLTSNQRQARKINSGHSPTLKIRLLCFNRTQSRVVIGLFIGHIIIFLLNGADY